MTKESDLTSPMGASQLAKGDPLVRGSSPYPAHIPLLYNIPDQNTGALNSSKDSFTIHCGLGLCT
jgi:hypothetical protein